MNSFIFAQRPSLSQMKDKSHNRLTLAPVYYLGQERHRLRKSGTNLLTLDMRNLWATRDILEEIGMV